MNAALEEAERFLAPVLSKCELMADPCMNMTEWSEKRLGRAGQIHP